MSGPAETTPEEQRWLQEVVAPELGEPIVEWPAWRTWLHEIFETEGPLRGSALWARAHAAKERVATAACERVAADVTHSTGRSVTVQAVTSGYSIRIACEGAFSNHDSGGFFSIDAEQAAVEVADTVRDILVEEWWTLWPQCHEHDGAMELDVVEGSAVWTCRRGGHSYPVGELTGPAPAGTQTED